MDDDQRDRTKEVMHIGMVEGFDMRAYSLAIEIKEFLRTIADEGTGIDTGTFAREADIDVTIGGVEYYITVRPSNVQLLKEGVPREELGLPPCEKGNDNA